ncbi:hypothetical protein DFJ58DRAFT_835370 [Suillus subalutaceus]|uniref:uncharacterized protein n=1 Tax=Suillus subalutaceus TaxID=48586 RepID=UPI001B873D6B|nr:uncharacterized protein DFJ58DRAFT_835370 [Suillus subalutaceus]KAG1877630.1 hypothetical protein DFJ58DRAFT_835370 [Suillus subalutaceus]
MSLSPEISESSVFTGPGPGTSCAFDVKHLPAVNEEFILVDGEFCFGINTLASLFILTYALNCTSGQKLWSMLHATHKAPVSMTNVLPQVIRDQMHGPSNPHLDYFHFYKDLSQVYTSFSSAARVNAETSASMFQMWPTPRRSIMSHLKPGQSRSFRAKPGQAEASTHVFAHSGGPTLCRCKSRVAVAVMLMPAPELELTPVPPIPPPPTLVIPFAFALALGPTFTLFALTIAAAFTPGLTTSPTGVAEEEVSFVVLGSNIVHGLSIPFFNIGHSAHSRMTSTFILIHEPPLEGWGWGRGVIMDIKTQPNKIKMCIQTTLAAIGMHMKIW